MFGYVKPYRPTMMVWQDEYYKALYCGLCRSMKRHTGALSTLTLQYDLVFLVLLQLALRKENVTLKKQHCILHPITKKRMAQEHPALEYAAFASALLTVGKLQDDKQDNDNSFKSFVLTVLTPFSKSLEKRGQKGTCGDLQNLWGFMRQSLAELDRLEQEHCDSPDRVAVPFGNLLGEVFACAFDKETECSQRRIAKEIGFHVGKWIYFADLMDDLPADEKKQSYNPLRFVPESEKAHALDSLVDAMNLECRAAMCALDLAGCEPNNDNFSVLCHLLQVAMPKKAEAIRKSPGKKQKTDLTEKD